jgi:hypothetical protein
MLPGAPKHIVIPGGKVGVDPVLIKIGTTCQRLVVVNTHGTGTLLLSFDGANWLTLPKLGGQFNEDVSISEFSIKGSIADVTVEAYAVV